MSWLLVASESFCMLFPYCLSCTIPNKYKLWQICFPLTRRRLDAMERSYMSVHIRRIGMFGVAINLLQKQSWAIIYFAFGRCLHLTWNSSPSALFHSDLRSDRALDPFVGFTCSLIMFGPLKTKVKGYPMTACSPSITRFVAFDCDRCPSQSWTRFGALRV